MTDKNIEWNMVRLRAKAANISAHDLIDYMDRPPTPAHEVEEAREWSRLRDRATSLCLSPQLVRELMEDVRNCCSLCGAELTNATSRTACLRGRVRCSPECPASTPKLTAENR